MWEGPAVYRTVVHIPEEHGWLLFHGVSYLAVVMINDEVVCTHEGIWDAFSVDLAAWSGQTVELKVRVVKNGGETYPVPDVASGFLPYVYGTFGGVYRPVELVVSESDPVLAKPKVESRVSVDGVYVSLDGKPWEMRGLLTWGWQPGFVSPDRTGKKLDEWIDKIQALGFNTLKFCLWIPTHETLERMHAKGMEAWIELPIWMPNPDKLLGMTEELKRIVSQYRHHPNIVAWTIGCELGKLAPAEWRKEMVRFVLTETNCPLVMDSSGGSEMYGGDPREYGTFYDFHPYCDTHFYPQVIDSLLTGPREKKPIFLGEFCDHDSLRDLGRIGKENPFWASEDEYFNAQGVRWQYDLPKRGWDESLKSEYLIQRSIERSQFHRKTTLKHARSQPGIAGWVVTGEIDTPISSSGIFDDWGMEKKRVMGYEFGPQMLAQVPKRRAPWIHGGNRPGWQDTFFQSESDALDVRFVIRSPAPLEEHTLHTILPDSPIPEDYASNPGRCLEFAQAVRVGMVSILEPMQFKEFPHGVGSITLMHRGKQWDDSLESIWIVDLQTNWRDVHFHDPTGHLQKTSKTGSFRVSTHGLEADESQPGIEICHSVGTVARPGIRECFHRRNAKIDADLEIKPLVASDRAFDPHALDEHLGKNNWTSLLDRVDTRTFEILPLLVRSGDRFFTTLRLGGGHGNQPIGLDNNPIGQQYLKWMLTQLGWSEDSSSSSES
jgi:hypothetical protein